MPPGESCDAAVEHRVLLWVATRKDAEVSTRLLAKGGIAAVTCASVAELTREIERGAAAVLATDELIRGDDVRLLYTVIEAQEPWSDLPFVLLVSGASQLARTAGVLERLGNVTLLERPAPLRSVLSTVSAAVRARKRQYATRALIEETRRAEALARQADRAKDHFLAALSHELRTPLTPVLLTASEGASDMSIPAQCREAFAGIAKSITLEARLIDDLLDLNRITRGKLKLDQSAVDATAVLSDAMANVQPDFAQKNIELIARTSAEPAIVHGDATRLQQVFWNVLRNAAKFTPAHGSVTVQAGTVDRRYVIEVTDTGIGMTTEELSRAFDAFAQGDHATSASSHQFGGLGLGLAISRSLVELHSGMIVARSDGQGRGSTFRIELPLAEGPVREAAQRSTGGLPRTWSGDPLRILLVEDHEPSREAMSQLLRRRKHAVQTAGSIAEAVALAREQSFDVLISDIGLPDGTGYALLQAIHSLQDCVAIALTGYGMEDDVERARDAGFVAHLTKPLRIADLEDALASVSGSIG